jgi:CBS domain containing-hemolysin-like protein
MRLDQVKSLLNHPDKLLSTVLWLVAFHSLVMGLILILQPSVLMQFAGFGSDCGHFFPAQGGVFHLLIFVVYLMGAIHIEKYHYFIVFSIFVKAVATFFLTIYCFAVEFKWVILLSGIADGMMGLMIFTALQYYLHTKSRDSRDCKK